MKNLLSLSLFIIFFINSVLANDICELTEPAINNYEPSFFEKTNNLLRVTGEEALYCGEKILVTGRVIDQDCKPVADAKIYAWQVNCNGKYPYKPLKDKADLDEVDLSDTTTFTGNGMAMTNNLGEFYFITIHPRAVHDLLPHMNIRVKHRQFGKLQTRLTLAGHKIINLLNHPRLQDLVENTHQQNISVYNFDIVMPTNIIGDD